MQPFIFIREDGRFVKVMLADIQYIEASKNYIRICTGKRLHLAQIRMRQIEAALPEEAFIRIHRSFIVPLAGIIAFDNKWVYLENKQLPVGDAYRCVLLPFTVPNTPVKKKTHAPAAAAHSHAL